MAVSFIEGVQSAVLRPAKELKGIASPPLEPGETRRVRVEMDRRSFAYYDVDRGDWTVSPGEFEILVGRSSEVIELRRKLTFTR